MPRTERRPTQLRRAAVAEGAELAARLGSALRHARYSTGLSQADAAERARLAQSWWSELERGHGAGAPLDTWMIAAAAVGSRLAAFLEAAPGSTPPRDIEHLRRQNAVIAMAASGGWKAGAEVPASTHAGGRFIDVKLERPTLREALVVEVWDLVLDAGAAFRGLDAKVAAVQANLVGWNVAGCWVLRDTRRNRGLVRELTLLFAARFPGDGRALLRSLADPALPMPVGTTLLWSGTRDATSIRPARLQRGQIG